MSDVDINYWRTLRNSLVQAMLDRGISLEKHDATLITRFFLEHIEVRGILLVPDKPTKGMIDASLRALDVGIRMTERWVSARSKHRQRLVAAVKAAPDWRAGMAEERDATDKNQNQ